MEVEREFGLTCPVCQDLYDDDQKRTPKNLKCSHTVCTSCIGHMVDVAKAKRAEEDQDEDAHAAATRIECPTCRRPTVVDDVDALGTNYEAKRKIRAMAHNEAAPTCQRHEGRMIVGFCERCAIPVCNSCQHSPEHNKHHRQIIDLPVAYASLRAGVNLALATVRPAVQHANAYRAALAGWTRSVGAEKTTALQSVRREYDERVKAIEDRYAQLKHQIDDEVLSHTKIQELADALRLDLHQEPCAVASLFQAGTYSSRGAEMQDRQERLHKFLRNGLENHVEPKPAPGAVISCRRIASDLGDEKASLTRLEQLERAVFQMASPAFHVSAQVASELLESGTVDAVVALLLRYADSPPVVEVGCHALARMCPLEAQTVQTEHLQAVVHALQSCPPTATSAQRAACWALRNMLRPAHQDAASDISRVLLACLRARLDHLRARGTAMDPEAEGGPTGVLTVLCAALTTAAALYGSVMHMGTAPVGAAIRTALGHVSDDVHVSANLDFLGEAIALMAQLVVDDADHARELASSSDIGAVLDALRTRRGRHMRLDRAASTVLASCADRGLAARQKIYGLRALDTLVAMLHPEDDRYAPNLDVVLTAIQKICASHPNDAGWLRFVNDHRGEGLGALAGIVRRIVAHTSDTVVGYAWCILANIVDACSVRVHDHAYAHVRTSLKFRLIGLGMVDVAILLVQAPPSDAMHAFKEHALVVIKLLLFPDEAGIIVEIDHDDL